MASLSGRVDDLDGFSRVDGWDMRWIRKKERKKACLCVCSCVWILDCDIWYGAMV